MDGRLHKNALRTPVLDSNSRDVGVQRFTERLDIRREPSALPFRRLPILSGVHRPAHHPVIEQLKRDARNIYRKVACKLPDDPVKQSLRYCSVRTCLPHAEIKSGVVRLSQAEPCGSTETFGRLCIDCEAPWA